MCSRWLTRANGNNSAGRLFTTLRLSAVNFFSKVCKWSICIFFVLTHDKRFASNQLLCEYMQAEMNMKRNFLITVAPRIHQRTRSLSWHVISSFTEIKTILYDVCSGCTVMAVCNHTMEVGARWASFIFTNVGVELEWCRMTVGQLDSFILAKAIISIYWHEQLWNSGKADWYWAPRVTNWIEKLRERRASTSLIDSAVMKHLWGEHPRETRVRVASQCKVKSQGKVRALHGTHMAECPWARENGSIQAVLKKNTPWVVKYHVNDVENYHI